MRRAPRTISTLALFGVFLAVGLALAQGAQAPRVEAATVPVSGGGFGLGDGVVLIVPAGTTINVTDVSGSQFLLEHVNGTGSGQLGAGSTVYTTVDPGDTVELHLVATALHLVSEDATSLTLAFNVPSAGRFSITNDAGASADALLFFFEVRVETITPGETDSYALPPIAVDDDALDRGYVLDRGSSLDTASLALPSVIANDTDLTGGLTLSVIPASGAAPAFGTLSLDASGSFVYANTDDATGAAFDLFTYLVVNDTVIGDNTDDAADTDVPLQNGAFGRVEVLMRPGGRNCEPSACGIVRPRHRDNARQLRKHHS